MVTDDQEICLSRAQERLKRSLDIILALSGLIVFWWLILLAWIIACADTKSNGLFVQCRVGLNGKRFNVFKIKTMSPIQSMSTTVTLSSDPRITTCGAFFRNTKIDELPQLWNVLIGDMSFVGPRPDVPGFADELKGDECALLNVRPGITGPATLKYKNEETILAHVDNPELYNKQVIWPDKVKINLEYIKNWSIKLDLECIIKTVVR
ncbi:MAG: sugar transferase [Oceanospirillaceae bacterium]|nr:sugar transferase [Oceanospirillaceae bacterium]|tara:strand:+ start:16489 stop:17112 length:624 start_codon:yes stop_codon:yes gene_type:complete